jgi:hypothetical protein
MQPAVPMANRTENATNKVDVVLYRIFSEEADPLEISASFTLPALNGVQFRGLTGEDFCRETNGKIIDFAEDPAGTDKSKEWRTSLGMHWERLGERLANCLANLDRILPLSLWSPVIFWQRKGPGAGKCDL